MVTRQGRTQDRAPTYHRAQTNTIHNLVTPTSISMLLDWEGGNQEETLCSHGRDLNPGHRRWKVTVLSTAPSHHPYSHTPESILMFYFYRKLPPSDGINLPAGFKSRLLILRRTLKVTLLSTYQLNKPTSIKQHAIQHLLLHEWACKVLWAIHEFSPKTGKSLHPIKCAINVVLNRGVTEKMDTGRTFFLNNVPFCIFCVTSRSNMCDYYI